MVTGIVTAIVPALQSSRQDLSTALKDGRGGDASPPGRRLRQALVVAQVALSLVLIVCSSLLSRSGQTLVRGTHFDPSAIAVLRIRPELARYPAIAPRRSPARSPRGSAQRPAWNRSER